MNEDMYDEWNSLKNEISQSKKTILFKEGEIWWCSLGCNIGSESFGKGKNFSRPVLVLKKLSHETSICIPLTSKVKVGSWFAKISILSTDRYVMLNQIRMIHIKRFQRRLTHIESSDFLNVKEKLKVLLGLS